MIKDLKQYEVWFITGSQHLYGDETLKQVVANSKIIAGALNDSEHVPVTIQFKELVTTPDEIYKVCEEANSATNCIGVILWMHTFSPAKMWIRGLSILNKPFCHLHTQFNTEIPWKDIDMDFMNLNQSAHGDREFGFMVTRMRKNRKIVVGHWKEKEVQQKVGNWTRVAAGWNVFKSMKVARIGDNMREVAVTEGDKVEAQMRFGFSVNGYGLGDVAKYVDGVSDGEIQKLVDTYINTYEVSGNLKQSTSLKEAARIEIGLRAFLQNGNFEAFTDTFENLYGLKQLPGIAAQRLMGDGYGFGAEGDWKTAALLRAVKVMDIGLDGGTSFMEDYTYDFRKGKTRVLGAHMLEICPSIAYGKPKLEVHPLGIGGKEDPARLVFNVASGPAINASLVDMGNRFRLLINEVEAVYPENDLPKLPVARVLWDAKPSMEVSAEAWIIAGGAHHTVFSKAVTTEMMEDFAEIAGIECVIIDNDTNIRSFKDAMRANEVYYHLFKNNM